METEHVFAKAFPNVKQGYSYEELEIWIGRRCFAIYINHTYFT